MDKHSNAPKTEGFKPSGLVGKPVLLLLAVVLPCILIVPLFLAQLDTGASDQEDYYAGWYDEYEEELPQSRQPAVLVSSICIFAAAALGYGGWALASKKKVAPPAWIVVSAFMGIWLALGLYWLPDGFGQATTLYWLLICSLAMVPLFVSMVHLVVWLTPQGEKQSIGKTLLPMLAVPVIWYLLYNTFRYSMSYYVDIPKSSMNIAVMLAVVSTYCFLFILMRVVYLLAARREQFWKVTRVVILFVLPLLGLLVTQIAPDFSFFWDFSSPVYYLLVAANGTLLLLREPAKKGLRLLLFFGRCATYIFVTYFFVVLSPFYTLSLLAILLFGLGVVVLAPVFLWIYQTKVLLETGSALVREAGVLKTAGAALLGVVLLPAAVSGHFMLEKSNFTKAMGYLDGAVSVVGEDAGPVDIEKLTGSLNYLDYGDQVLRFNYSNRDQLRKPPPILSKLSTSIVNGGEPLVYPESAYVDALYYHRANSLTGRDSVRNYEGGDDVDIINIRVETEQVGDYYKSMLHFVMYNRNDWDDLAEYSTIFTLPDGVFISGYYLTVEEERKPGLLSERSAAVSVYEDIVSAARDPGILYYFGGNVVFRVFPFTESQIRTTGIELIHPGPVTLEIDGRTVELATGASNPKQPVDSGNGVVYYSAEAKEILPTFQRRPHYIFVLDFSEGADKLGLVERMMAFCEAEGIPLSQATVNALNYRRAVWPMDGLDLNELMEFPVEGGFGLGLVADAMIDECVEEDTYPVMVVVSDQIGSAILPKDTSYMAGISPETDGYYILGHSYLDEGYISLYPYDSDLPTRRMTAMRATPEMKVAEVHGETHYLRNNGMPELVGYQADAAVGTLSGLSWDNALKLYGQYQQTHYHEEEADMAAAQIGVVKNSFRTGIMTPLTSYIVVETEEQEAEILARQERILERAEMNGTLLNHTSYYEEVMDGENPMMSEPSLVLCAAVMFVVLWWHRRKKAQDTATNAA